MTNWLKIKNIRKPKLTQQQIREICIRELNKTAEAIKDNPQHYMLYSTLTLSITVLKELDQ